MTVSKRLLRFSIFVLACLILGRVSAETPKPSAQRPNILIISGDDHAAYSIGAYGSEMGKTPHINHLAETGALFERAYCNSPVCTASRQSYLTGRLPHAVGVTLLHTPLPDEELTLAEYLKLSGYQTAAIGKMHFNSAKKHGFDLRVDAPDYKRSLQEGKAADVSGQKTLGPWKPMADPARTWLNADTLPYPARDAQMDASFYVSKASEFMKKTGGQPFFLMVSFTQPHSPFHFPVEYAGKYDPSKIPVPFIYPLDPPQIPLVFRDLTDADKKGIIASYYTSVEYLDTKVGQVLAALDAAGKRTNTIVVYMSDHGYNLGHHGRFEKHSFFEPAVHTPLIISWPGKIREKRKITSLVELVDLFPTLCDAAGMPTPKYRHGKSLMPVLTGALLEQEHRSYVVSQYHENEEAMVRTDRYKLVYCSGKRARMDGYKTDQPTPGRTIRLFDVKTDPHEAIDLSEDPFQAERIEVMKSVLLDRLQSTVAPIHRPPAHFSLEEKLDWYLVPPEVAPRG